jgi:hypothetical protein
MTPKYNSLLKQLILSSLCLLAVGFSIECTTDSNIISPLSQSDKSTAVSPEAMSNASKEPGIQWMRTVAKFDQNLGIAYYQPYYSMQTQDRGYAIFGTTTLDAADKSTIRIIKADKSGNPLWEKVFACSNTTMGQPWKNGLLADSNFLFLSVIETDDKGFAILGTIGAMREDFRAVWLIKTDPDGNKLWDKLFKKDVKLWAKSIRQTPDGGYIIGADTGYGTKPLMFAIRIDDSGKQIWEKAIPKEGASLNSIIPTSDGGFQVCATVTERVGFPFILLKKIDAVGNNVWEKSIGSEDKYTANSMILMKNGDIAIAGRISLPIKLPGNFLDSLLIKTDNLGNLIWKKVFGNGQFMCVNETKDGDLILGGSKSLPPEKGESFGRSIAWILKADHLGEKTWEMNFVEEEKGCCYSAQQTTDGGYCLSAVIRTQSDSSSDSLRTILIKLM